MSSPQLRFAFFLTQGVVNARVVLRTNLDAVAIARTLLTVLTAPPGQEPSLTGSDLLGRPLEGPEAAKMSAFWDENLRAVLKLFREEMDAVEAGVYKMPYDLRPLSAPGGASPQLPGPLSGLLGALPLPALPALAPQWDPVRVFSTAAAYMRDQAAVAARREAKNGTEVASQVDPAEAESGRYPKYFLQNFHWQSGGWLSADSAELYDYQVETLFLGSADAMRRRAMPALSRFAAQPRFAGGAQLQLFDAATGTGRFLSFVLDSFDNVRATASDLSPYYLDKARDVLRPWEKRVSFLEANVEAVPLPDASFDAVTCVYLFHGAPIPSA